MINAMILPYLIRYAVGGASVFIVSIGSLYLLVDVLGFWYLWATTITFIISISLSFAVQKYWTFRDRLSDGLREQVGAYVAIVLFNLVVNDSAMYLMVDKIKIPYLFAQVGTTLVIATWSFFACSYLFLKANRN